MRKGVKIMLLIACFLGLACMAQAADDPSERGRVNMVRKPALFDAAASGNLSAVRDLAEKGADVNQSINGVTPLCFATKQDIIIYLMDKGADVNAPFLVHDPKMRMQLFVSLAWMMQPDVVDLAFRKGLTQASADRIWFIFITWLGIGDATRSEAALVASTKLMLDHGADANAKGVDPAGDEKETALMLAVRSGSVNIVKLLIDKGADVNARNQEGRSVLTIAKTASRNKTGQLVEVLLQAGAKP